jgi:hypothetical protein
VIALTPFDQLVVETTGDTVVLVTLRWSGQPEAPPCPETETLDSAVQLERMIESDWGAPYWYK